MIEPYDVIGRSVSRVDSVEKLTGGALYAGDISFPGMLHVKVLRSDRPHARILRIITSEAKAHPDVVAVLTNVDIPGNNVFGRDKPDQMVLCMDRVRFVGDPISAGSRRDPRSGSGGDGLDPGGV